MGNNKPSLSNRNSNIELLRILCMLAMPMQHYISRGGIVESCEVFNVNNLPKANEYPADEPRDMEEQ